MANGGYTKWPESNNPQNSKLLTQLLDPLRKEFGQVFAKPEKYRLQIIYTQINRDKQNKPVFTHHFFHVTSQYCYPASTVKLPAAVVALEAVNALSSKGINKYSTMLTEPVRPGELPVYNDPSTDRGKPSVGQYVKKILLVSDNDAFNRLYELIGQEPFNQRLWQLGFTQAQMRHRLSLPLNDAENRLTNTVWFANDTGAALQAFAARKSGLTFSRRTDKIGKGYMRGRTLVGGPMDFSSKNRWPLLYHHRLVQWIMFPESQPASKKLRLTQHDYHFLRKYMNMLPSESNNPAYNEQENWPAYCKFLLAGSEKGPWKWPGVRIFNKVGDAYGFLLDAAYIADFEHGVEFILSMVVYCNDDGILNDDSYDYDKLGFPFMKRVGEVIYNYELSRPRKQMPDLSEFKFDY